MLSRILPLALLAALPTLAAEPAENRIPLFFVANAGQAPAEVRFMARGSGLTAYFLQNEALFHTFSSTVRMRMEGADPAARVEGAAVQSGHVNFLTGAKKNWRTGLPMFGVVAYRGIYPGIDMLYGGSGRNLKSEFVVAPGADPSLIRVRYIGAAAIRLDENGALVIPLASEVLHERAPELYQMRAGKRLAVEGRFQIAADGAIGFAIGAYDHSLPLTIDPVISYSTFLGGSSADAANAIALDSSGAAYVAGFTESFNFPTLSPVQAANGGGNDAFVAKLSSAGNALVYATYLGGSAYDQAYGIAVDSTGAAYITGSTQSANFPMRNALQANLAGGKNAFVAKLTPAGNGLVYSTFLGGNGSDSGNGIAVDSSGNAYIVGDTTSTNFPATGFQKTFKGGQDAFVAKLNAAGSSLVYSTYLGGGNLDHGAAIAVDATGTAYITGSTTSTDFPVANAFQAANGGGQNAFIARLNATGASLLFSTFLGGSGGRTGYPEGGQGIAIDSAGNTYVAGVTSSTNFPLMNPEQSTLDGSSDAFVAKLSSTGSLVYSTYLGGSGIDSASAIAVDPSGNAYVAGYTYSIDLPVVSAVQSTIGSIGSTDAFVGKLNAAGNALTFLTYLGGNDSDTAAGVSVDASGNIYVAGWTLSANFPTANAYQTSNGGNYGAFITKYSFSVGPVNVGVTPNSGSGSTQTFAFQYSDANGTSDLISASALFNTSSSLAAACAVIYTRAANTLALLTDTGGQPSGVIIPGSGTQQNSQCMLNGAGSTVSISGNLLTLNLAIVFQGAFGGAKNIYMQSSNPYQTTAWQSVGNWSAPGAITMTVTPSSGSATQQTFAFAVTDPLGVVADLTSVSVLVNSSTSVVGACSVIYTRAANTLALLTDAGSQPSGAITPGSGSQQNSQCTLSGAGSTVSVVGNVLTVTVALTFQSAFGGAKNVYMQTVSKNGTVGFTQVGIWTSPPLVTLAVSPASGSANLQTFSIQVSDSTGAADLTTIGALWNATASATSGCAVIYNQAQNTLGLLTDAGTEPPTTLTPGSGSQQNSQCILNGAASTIAPSGNTLTAKLAITFQPSFSGAKNVYVDAANPYEALAWQLEGTWISPPTVAMAVAPSSGSGSQQLFAFSVTDSLAATDLTTLGVLIGNNPSTAGACSVTYNRAQNTLALLTDAGALPATTIAPGSGTQQNSQCTLSGSGSSVSTSGNTVTVSLLLTFQAAFTGTKNVYMEAANPYETIAWMLEGTWVSAAAPAILVTPSSGSADQQTFALQVTDPLGAADLATVGLSFNSTVSTIGACTVTYNRAQNALMLLTDSGTAPPTTLTPGSGTQQNSQCILNGAGSSASASGNILTVNLAIGFQPAFSGTRNMYAEAIGANQTLNWQQEGTWTSPPLVTLALTPLSGSGTQQSFTLKVTDSLSGGDLTTVGLLINSTVSTSAACSVTYNSGQNTLALLTDAGAPPAIAIAPGSGTQQNSQCVLNGAGSSVFVSGTTLTVNLAIAFQPAFTGSKNVYIDAANPYETVTWQLEGVWVVPSALSVSVTPSSGSASQQVFNLQVTDPAGGSDLTTVGLMFNTTVNTAGGCTVLYNRAQNTLMLLTDSGAQPSGSIAPGSGSQQNSQCLLNGAASSASVGGNVLSLNVSIGFQQAYTGTKNLYAEALGAAQSLNWQQEGIWALPQVLTMAVTPSSGAGAQQTFSLQFSDTLGASDLTTLGLLFNPSTGVTSACAVTYNRAQNALTLLTDAGAAPSGSLTPGSGSQQNSLCTLSGAGSTVVTSGNTLTLNLSISFQTAFSGAKNIYLEAASSFQAATWTLEGAWALPAIVTMSASPSSGGGPQQLFSFQASDSIAATDLSTVGIMLNTSISTVSGCVVMYNRAQNALTLLTDAGAAPSGSLTPGSGSQQNSQCTLNSAASSVTASGTALTLNLSLSFFVTWVGTKTVYMEAVNPYQSGTWTSEGRWVTSASLTVSGTPTTGTGTTATFTIQGNESWGATNVTTEGIMINSSVSTVGGCVVTYNWTGNTLMLLTDSGAAPSSAIAPGSGTQQNSQCILNGAGSSVTAVSTTLTLNVSLTFLPAFAGAKNTYVEAIDPFRTLAWTSLGTWTLPQGVTMTLTPSSGSGSQQTFSLVASDSLGTTDLTTLGFLFNSSTSAVSACAVTYNRAQNALTLLTDAGAAPSGSLTPGSGSQQNSQCTLSGAGSSVTAAGNTLTLNLALTFLPAFGGSKNLYAEAGSSLQAASWTLEGTWASAATVTMSMSPASGGGPQQLYSFQVSDSVAATDLTTVGIMFNTSASTVSGCVVMYNRAQNALSLLTDAGAAPSGSLTPGSGSQQNSQCTLNGAASSVTASGTTLTLNLSLSFFITWVGTKTAYMEAVNPYQSGTWTSEGHWVTSATLTATATPTSGTGTSATFTLQASESWGATDVTTEGLMINTSLSTVGGCVVTYNWLGNALMLLTDSGAAPSGSIAPGSSGTQQNSQCILNGAGSSVSAVSTTLTVTVSLTFLPAFAGTRNTYVEAIDAFRSLPWASQGTWIVPQGLTMTLTPSSGSGTQQTFSLQVSDSLGTADLTTLGISIGTSSSLSGACAVTYNRPQNALTLLTDAGAAPSGALTPGSGSQQNSQCALSGAGSTATASGTTLTLNFSISFLPAFSGSKNLYAEAGSSLQAASWTLEGAWIAASPAVVTMSVSPSSGGGPQQMYSFQATDSIAATDLSSVGIMFNASVSTVSGCIVMYNQAQNALTLLTDAGAAPSGSLTPGSGLQQNSQCTLNGAASSVTASGTTLTLNLSLSFFVTWVGTKTVYMEAVNPYQSGTWTSEGRWVTSASLTVSGSPASGTSSTAIFTVQANESWGATIVTTEGLMINSSVSTASGCVVTYNWTGNKLMLLTDSGAAPASAIAPGSGTQQNSQCVLNGSGSSVTAVSTTLTLNVSLTFLPSFAGTKNTYVEAIDPFRTLTWTSQGSWTVPPGSSLGPGTSLGAAFAASPALGSGPGQTFSLQYSTGGASLPVTVGFLVSASASAAGACTVLYNQIQNSLTLLTDSGIQPATSIAPGSGTQQNSQCTLNGTASSVSVSPPSLQLNLSLSFAPGFGGAKNLYMEAVNSAASPDWQLAGSWTVAANGASAAAVTPSSGSAGQQVFSFRFTDTAGTANLSTVFAWFMSADRFFSFPNSCVAYYNTSQNLLYLSGDGEFWQPPAAPGTPGSLGNSQCSINLGASTVTASGNDLILNLSITFAPSFSGNKALFMRTDPMNGASSGWSNQGSWTVPSRPGASTAPAAPSSASPSVLPSSGAGYRQIFNLQYLDAFGAADLSTVWATFAPDSGRGFPAGGCTAYYNQQQNLLYLVTDDNDYTQSAAPGAPALLANSQCSIDVAAARVAPSGASLTLSLPVSFAATYSGSKSVYMNAVSADGASSGWTVQGFWLVPEGRLPLPAQR